MISGVGVGVGVCVGVGVGVGVAVGVGVGSKDVILTEYPCKVREELSGVMFSTIRIVLSYPETLISIEPDCGLPLRVMSVTVGVPLRILTTLAA